MNINHTGVKNPMFGKKHSEETKRKIAEANRGRIKTKEEIEKARKSNTGQKRSEETKKKISDALTNQKRPWIMGVKNPNWQGGKTTEAESARSSVTYRLWRIAVFERDKYTCVIGGKEHGNKLNADHIKPFSLYPELRFAIDNGRTLCEACHKKTPTYGRPTKLSTVVSS